MNNFIESKKVRKKENKVVIIIHKICHLLPIT